MLPWHNWYISRRLDIDICIYVTDYYKPSLHVSTDCLHANTQDDHANYDLLGANSFSLIFRHQAAQIGGNQETTKTHKKKNYSQEVAGALSPPTPPSYSLRRGTIFCQRATKGAKQSRPAAGCSSLKNSKGNGWISLRLFITSQPCRRNREFSLNSVLRTESMMITSIKKWGNVCNSK